MEKAEFYIKNYNFTQETGSIDLSFLNPNERRKLNDFDKKAISSMEKIYNNDIDSVIFSSKYGQFDKLNKIIEQYRLYEEISPFLFSSSVHNYLPAFFTRLKKTKIPYDALSSGNNLISAVLIRAIISRYNNILVNCTDESSLSFLLSKTEGKIRCRYYQTISNENDDEFNDFIKFLKGEINTFSSSYGVFERLN